MSGWREAPSLPPNATISNREILSMPTPGIVNRVSDEWVLHGEGGYAACRPELERFKRKTKGG